MKSNPSLGSGVMPGTALVLAGGESRRMGSPKALLDYQGQPLWKFQAEKLAQLGLEQIFISLPRDLEIDVAPWTVVRDRESGLGPLGGIEATLQLTKSEFLIVLAVDMPAVPVGFLEYMLEQVLETHRGIVPQLDGFFYGMVAIYPTSILQLVNHSLSTGERSFQHLVRVGIQEHLLKEFAVTEMERPFFINLNTPDNQRDAGPNK